MCSAESTAVSGQPTAVTSKDAPNNAKTDLTGLSPLQVHNLPFDALPDPKQVWPAAANSADEGLGRLVLLTPDVVAAAAASCIRTGRRVGLNWSLTKLDVANFGRNPTQHHITSLLGGAGFDDVYVFNPQQSSQWDGLRHFSAPFASQDNPKQRLFYGGTTASEIVDRSSVRIGMQHWAREGICGRGVLLDYAAYAERHGIVYKALSDHAIPLRVLQQVAQEQGTVLQRGDILFVRIGMVREWDDQMTPSDRLAYALDPNPQHAGVEGTEEVLRWLWDSGVAAVAGDAVSWEVYPPKKSYPAENEKDAKSVPGLFLHEYLLPAWGMPVGELFDLEGLSQLCAELGRYEFFVASAPLNMPGGVSSPPNCVAIF